MLAKSMSDYVHKKSVRTYNEPSVAADALNFCSLPQHGLAGSDAFYYSGENLLETVVSNASRIAGIGAFFATAAAFLYWVL